MTKEVNREQQEKLPTKKGTLQVFFANAVRRGKEGEILTHMGSDKPKRGHYGLVHDDSYDCESPEECREEGHVVYLSATVVLKALGLRRGTPISFGARTNDDGKARAVFVRFTTDRDSKMIPPEVAKGR